MRAAVNIGRAPSPVPILETDFRTGAPVYRLNGVSYASFTAMGGTVTGSPTINTSGLTCGGSSDVLTIPLSVAGDYIIFVDADWASSDGRTLAYFKQPSGSETLLSRGNSSTVRARQNGSFTLSSPSDFGRSTVKVAAGIVGTNLKFSYDNTATATLACGASSFPSASLAIGNLSGGGVNWNAAIRKLTVYEGSLADAEIRALTI